MARRSYNAQWRQALAELAREMAWEEEYGRADGPYASRGGIPPLYLEDIEERVLFNEARDAHRNNKPHEKKDREERDSEGPSNPPNKLKADEVSGVRKSHSLRGKKDWRAQTLENVGKLLANSTDSWFFLVNPRVVVWRDEPNLADVYLPREKLTKDGVVLDGDNERLADASKTAEMVLDCADIAYLGSYTPGPPVVLSVEEYLALPQKVKKSVLKRSVTGSMRGSAAALQIPGQYLSGERHVLKYELTRAGRKSTIARIFR